MIVQFHKTNYELTCYRVRQSFAFRNVNVQNLNKRFIALSNLYSKNEIILHKLNNLRKIKRISDFHVILALEDYENLLKQELKKL